jgi:alpha-beta hydrolase superfamily lysophospholipase
MLHRRRLLLAALAASSPAAAAPTELTALDGVRIGANTGSAAQPRRATILLFHQAGANLGEYAPISPRLNRLGFDTLAIDQRSGGTGFGQRNTTVERLGRSQDFAAALPDLEAALAWAKPPSWCGVAAIPPPWSSSSRPVTRRKSRRCWPSPPANISAASA